MTENINIVKCTIKLNLLYLEIVFKVCVSGIKLRHKTRHLRFSQFQELCFDVKCLKVRLASCNIMLHGLIIDEQMCNI